MAKIILNNTEYTIDDSVLTSAKTELQTHLSTTMNGSGASISLGDVTYNVDSSKLTTATNGFVSYLGTIAGNGAKIVVNGVEYAVDSTKISNAMSELGGAFGELENAGEVIDPTCIKAGTYTLKDVVDFSTLLGDSLIEYNWDGTISIGDFSLDGGVYFSIHIKTDGTITHNDVSWVDNGATQYTFYNNGWTDQKYRTWIFEADYEVDEETGTWFYANLDKGAGNAEPEGFTVTISDTGYGVLPNNIYISDDLESLPASAEKVAELAAGDVVTVKTAKKYIGIYDGNPSTWMGGATTTGGVQALDDGRNFEVTGDGTIDFSTECLTGDTLVTMADRTEKRIDEIEVGDYILSYDWGTMSLVPNKVTYTDKDMNKTHTEYDVWTFDDGSVVKTVHRHRFFNVERKAFVYMDEWKIGEHTVKIDGSMPMLVSHETVVETVNHYKISGELGTNYFANGLLTGDRYCPTEIDFSEIYTIYEHTII